MKAIKFGLAAALLLALAASPALAGAKLKINDDSQIDFGFRLQTLFIMSDEVRAGQTESYSDFKIRRGRLRVKLDVNENFSAFVQTEVGGTDGGSGQDVRIIDAWISVKKNNWAQLFMGMNMAPASRQNLTSSGALMAIDRPGTTYKSLTWGARALRTFSNTTYGGTASGLSGSVAVRDLGATLFGSGEVGENANLKYYLAVNDGIQNADEDSFRYTGRVQLNLWDAEAGYYNSSTYLGKKKTLAFGLSIDQQADVAFGAATGDPNVDYEFMEADVFLEWPTSDTTALTAEAAFQQLDFDDAPAYLNSQGDGFYAQLGYMINKWQPWILYETWSSDDPGEVGNLTAYRVGLTYFIRGQNANFKIGYEKFETDVPFLTTDDSSDSIVLGFYTTY